ncbi:RNA polymerase-associated protein rtf1 [Coemansia thaxteri]|uniref:RNA polymerase-associated protein rtf1 n=1 Tax=Coemansia thaxteri TaxID=2663907 RepID=A0A9W8B9P0_9FUNG|nr:RNA polymerase-associated protein rtf1 [Coemansia thaxteri]KAJ2002859.1 RNA polymerase-associated protein rtf1 [Coemansia thaxteri]KAJ2465904.1 RNA polymerase-associated protein rtf1 [Coemansia sp. RSA 2322]KAJ2479070.1 RNA polymerase-associated protein rtf1 [Coemansia sp. RSA 2320]
MSNLEDDILDLFGGDIESGRDSERNRRESRSKSHYSSKRSHHGRYSRSPQRRSRRDDYSASDNDEGEDMDTGDDDDEIVDIGDAPVNNAPNDRADSDDEPLDQWGEDLMGGREDRAWLASLNEVERERILAERQETRDHLNEQREVRMKLKAGARVSGTDDMSKATRSRRGNRDSSGRGAASSGALSDLKRARERRRHGGSGRWSSASDDGEESDGGKKSTASLDEINTICISRNQLEQWLFKPFFAVTIVGCFVRIVTRNRDSNGTEYNQYKMMQVVDVVQGEGKDQPPYHLNKTLTDKYLVLRYGAVEKDYSMENISNSLIKTEEFGNWTTVLRTDRVRDRISAEVVQNKLQDMEKARNYKLSNQEINEMVAERNRLRSIKNGGIVGNLAQERARLNLLRTQARQDGDWEKLKDTEARLVELDKITGGAAKGEATPGGHKPLLAPSSSRFGGADGKKNQPVRRSKLLTPGSGNRIASPATLSATAKLSGPSGAMSSFALVPEVKQQELTLRSAITPGYTEMMAANGGYDMSFLML